MSSSKLILVAGSGYGENGRVLTLKSQPVCAKVRGLVRRDVEEKWKRIGGTFMQGHERRPEGILGLRPSLKTV
jgi:hypothetical protein